MKKYMNDMSDKELDDFFKQAAQQYDVPYEPADWQKMKGKLDRNGFAGNWKRWMGRGFYLALFLFLFSGTSQVNMNTSVLNTSLDESETKSDKTEIISGNVAEEKTTGQADVSQKRETPIAQETETQQASPPSPILREGNVKDEHANNASIQVNPMPVPTQQTSVSTVSEEEEKDYQASFIYPENFPLLTYLPLRYPSESGTLPPVKKVNINATNDTAKLSPEEVIQPKKRPLLSFSIMLAPDISAVKVREVNGVGRAAGINIEYFPLPNLSVNTGAVYAFKIYEVGEGSYGSYGGSSYNKLKSIDGNCRVLDVPLNLRYYVINLEKSRWYVSSGVSSYFMLTEDYEYKYEKKVPDKYRFHNYRNENQHYFKVLNLSVGYERKVGNHWAIQLEPYARVPLAGVGAGKIRLNTTGFFIALKYML